MGDILYEPRSLWDVQQTPVPTSAFPVLTRFRRERFHNGGRWPINLTRVTLCPINYIATQMAGQPATNAQNYRNSMAAVLKYALLRINVPFRRHLSRVNLPLTAMRTRRTWMPKLPAPEYASSAWGVSRLDFDRAVILPRLGSIRCDLTSYVLPDLGIFFGADHKGNNSVQVAMAFYENGGQLNGSLRLLPRTNIPPMLPANQPWGNITDAFGPYQAATITNNNAWPAEGSFSTKRFDAQTATRQGSTAISGIGVHVDQMNYDDSQGTAVIYGLDINAASPICTRMGVRILTEAGGTGEYWWQPGAPMALVFDTITPALVYPLAEPITLPPGDTLDVELEVPGITYPIENPMATQYNLGISFNGYAIIES